VDIDILASAGLKLDVAPFSVRQVVNNANLASIHVRDDGGKGSSHEESEDGRKEFAGNVWVELRSWYRRSSVTVQCLGVRGPQEAMNALRIHRSVLHLLERFLVPDFRRPPPSLSSFP